MKIVATLRNKKEIEILNQVDAFIIPLKDLSINYESYFELKEIKEIKNIGKEIFISINKNIHNNELETLKKVLLEIEKLNINGIIFYDIALVNLKQTLNLKTPLVWHQEHMTTNYQTCNYWYDKGCEYSYLSSELTLEEIKEIKQKNKSQIFVNVFGRIPMFTSKRHLINNYLETFNLKTKGKAKTLHKEDKYYPISDTKNGTTVYSNYILNALDIDFNFADYIVFNSYQIDINDFKEVINNFKEGINKYKYPFEHGFLYKKTIYKVKKGEKND